MQAITVVNGVAHVGPGMENLRRLLTYVARSDIAVAGGPEKPLEGNRTFPRVWRFLLDYGPRLLLPRRRVPPADTSAADLIRQHVLAADAPVTIVALGPLTNLALALRADPALASHIDTVVISGGALHVPGAVHSDSPWNPNLVSEWNLYIDPVAAEIVFNAGMRLVLIPMDVTHVEGSQPLLFGRALIRRLSQTAQGKASTLLVKFMRFWQPVARLRYSVTPVWDAAVAALAANPAICCDWRDLGIRILTEPDEVAGQTIIDADRPTKVRVCLGGDQDAFEADYLATVGVGR